MEIVKKITPETESPLAGKTDRTYVFFKVTYNHFRDVSDATAHEVRDRYEPAECEAVLCLPASYREEGEKTPLILCCHGAGGLVREAENKIGGVAYANRCIDEGFAVLDVNGSEWNGRSMGCFEHVLALHRAYRYAVKQYHLEERVMVAGASMGGTTAVNFSNTFPGIVTAMGLIYPRLNIDGVTVGDHYCIGTWDKKEQYDESDGLKTPQRIAKIFRFPTEEWFEPNTVGFNPYRGRSFVNEEGLRAVIPPCPVKLWQGLEDKIVDPVMVEEYANSIRRAGCYAELHLLEGVAHKLTPVMREELMLWFDRFR